MLKKFHNKNLIYILKSNYCIIILIMCLISFIFLSSFSYTCAISNDLSSSVFRLHIIANSDSNEDQNLKLKVRNAILQYLNPIFSKESNLSKNEVINIVSSNLNNIRNISLKTIKDNGYNYNVEVFIGKYKFPTKNYGEITFPSGIYDALRIVIGNGVGHNWWCVLYPSLCFSSTNDAIVPESSKEMLSNDLNTESYELVSGDNLDIKFKFKIVEIINNFIDK